MDAAYAASVPIFPVALGQASQDVRLRGVLEQLARATGGRVLRSSGAAQLRQAYDEVLTLLRASYLLGYRPAPEPVAASVRQGGDGGPLGEVSGPRGTRWRAVRMRVIQRNYRLLYRPGYYR